MEKRLCVTRSPITGERSNFLTFFFLFPLLLVQVKWAALRTKVREFRQQSKQKNNNVQSHLFHLVTLLLSVKGAVHV